MTPQDLARKHPRIYHLTAPDALPSIEKHGLLSTSQLLSLFDVPKPQRAPIERHRRSVTVTLTHPIHGQVHITDNLPLSVKALVSCLEDGLQPVDWLMMLNARVFFWPDEDNLANHLSARLNRGRKRLVLVFDTLKLAESYGDAMELTAINTGSTIRKPAKRGLSTFTPMRMHGYSDWRKLRGGNDRLREIAIVGGVPDPMRFIVEHYLSPAP